VWGCVAGRQGRQVLASGGKGIRTPDIQLAKLALYQLSYTPVACAMGGPSVFGLKAEARGGLTRLVFRL
jgi:hypothetical protein